MKALMWVALLCLTACGTLTITDDAGIPLDAEASSDGAGRSFDAQLEPDARPPLTSSPAAEITAVGSVMSGQVYKVEAQLGHWWSQRPVVGGGKTLEGAAAIK